MSSEFAVIYLFASILLSAIISVYAWRNPKTRGNLAFAAACLASIPWMSGEVVGRMTETFAWQWFGEILRYLGAMPLPVILLIFTRQYFGRDLSRREINWLLIVPAISLLVMATDPWHHLFFNKAEVAPYLRMQVEYGVYFWAIHTPYSYLMLLISLITVIMEFSGASRHYRRQISLLLVSICIPIAVNALAILGVIGKITPYSFPVFYSIMAYAIFRLQFLGSNPIAYETVFQTILDGVLILDHHDIVRDVNPAAAKEIGKPAAQIVGNHIRDVMSVWPGAAGAFGEDPAKLGELAVTESGATRYLLIDSTPLVADRGGKIEGRIISIRDITDRHRHQLTLEELAFHDPLTRLANRRKFEEEVDRAVARADESNEQFAILFFDLNRFKAVNDSLGHEVGDELLKYVAARVASILRKPDLLARLGGDEFAMLLHNCDENGVDLVKERLLDNVQRPFKVGENTLIADLSIGAAYYPKDGHNLTELLRNADAEMYRAKQSQQIPIQPTLSSPLEM